MAYLGSVGQFDVDTGNWKIYQEQLEQFMEVNKLKNDLKKSAMLRVVLVKMHINY